MFWTGTVSTDWNNPANWGTCGPPSCSESAIIYSGALNYPVITSGQVAACKSLDIKPGASITLTGTSELDVCGNFVNNGNLTASSTSIVNLTGSATQYFDGSMTGSNSFGILKMSKSNGTNPNMTLLDNAQVATELQLAATTPGGKIITNNYVSTPRELYITNGAASACNLGSATSHIVGNLRRNLNGNTGIYYFPVGHPAAGYQLAKVEFTSSHTIPDLYSFFTPWSSIPGPVNVIDAACNWNYDVAPGFLNNGYWTLTASANASSANYDMTLVNANYNNNFAAGSGFTVMKAATTAGPWSLNGNCFAGSTAGITKRSAMSGFSVFATGQTDHNTLITLLSFDAVTKGADVLTTWVTASEINNDYFIIERSKDGLHFEQVGTKKGAGNSTTTLYYTMTDYDPYGGVSYYRLRQVDFDGKESKSQLVAVRFLDNDDLNVYPVPVFNTVGYEFMSSAESEVSVEVVDMLGKVMMSKLITVKTGLNKFEDNNGLNVDFLSHGVYIMQIKPVTDNIIEPMQKRFLKQIKQE